MDGQELAAVIQAGEELLIAKLLTVSVQCLWVYDYFLNLGDEIKYAWSGMRSWIFVLFVANRYTPVLNLVWVHTTMFHYRKPATKWMVPFDGSVVVVLAQIAVALRVYCVTGRNKLIGGVLALLIAAQLSFGIFAVVWTALHPLQPIPEINLDAFKLCIFEDWKLGQLIYYNLTIFFDVLAFSIILITSRRPGMRGHPGIPSLLGTIVRGATQYFVLIFFVQLLAQLFLFFAPEGIHLLPGAMNTIFVPVMASRLMLSLKKAAVEPKGAWSLETMTTMSQGGLTGDGTIHSASRASSGLHEISEEGIELDVAPRLPRSCGP